MLAVGSLLAVLPPLFAQTPPQPAATTPTTNMEEVLVQAEDETAPGPFMPDVQGAEIFAGKKTSVLTIENSPSAATGNYRAILAQTPGLVLSEESTPLVSIGGRGFDPHRMQFFQVLQDGIPIHADPFGYPEAYYTPPLEAVTSMDVIRGGAALLYGPQPAGAINYITHMPRTDKAFHLTEDNTFGSYGYFSNYTAIDGTVGPLGYYGYYNHRQSDGFREANSSYSLDGGSIKLTLDAGEDTRLLFNFDAYSEENDEPGGLASSLQPRVPGIRYFDEDREATTRFNDKFELDRYVASMKLMHDFSDETFLEVATWGGYYRRHSRRQTGGGFGIVATGTTNNIETQEFYTFGFEPRLRHDYEFLNNTHTLTGGFQIYNNYSPRIEKLGTTPDATSGATQRDIDRNTTYFGIFLENRFVFDRLSIVPAVRLENYWTSVDENINLAKTAAGVALTNDSKHEFVPLPGVGVEFETFKGQALYANVSQSYRPNLFTEGFSSSATAVVASGIQPGDIWTYEVGYRGNPTPWIFWDTSFYFIDYGNRVGTLAGAGPGGLDLITNTGRSHTMGWEAAGGVDVIGLYDAVAKSNVADFWGSLTLSMNVTIQDGEFVSGPQEGFETQYTPDYVIRSGVVWDQEYVRVGLLTTVSSSYYADDANTPEREVPSYMVWDLETEFRVYKDVVTLAFGVNNLFNENYYSRVRGDGIDPAMGRNYYGSVKIAF